MSTLTINTTQNVNLDFTVASVGIRVLSFFIDIIIKISYSYVVTKILHASIFINNDFDDFEMVSIYIIALLPVFFYTLVFETLFNGQTPGKKLTKIKVVKIDGFQATFPDYLSRWLFLLVDVWILSGAIGILSIIITKKSQRIGDIAAGTAVISLKARTDIGHTLLMELSQNYQPLYKEAAFLKDNDARIIKDNLDKATLHNDSELLLRLRIKVEEVLKIKKADVSDVSFLQQILSDFNYYTGGSNS